MDQQVVRMPDGKLQIFSKFKPQKHAMTQTLPESTARKAARVVAVPLAPGQQAPEGANVIKSGRNTLITFAKLPKSRLLPSPF